MTAAAIKDIIIRFNFSFEFWYGQIYVRQKKWCYFSNISISTQGSSFSLFWEFIVVKDLNSNCKILDDVVLVKYFPK